MPVLYSFRRCPYAIRARLALYYSGITCELREVILKDKPPALLQVSSKGTVPVLVLEDDKTVLDESLDIMQWALQQHDPDGWLVMHDEGLDLIQANDDYFKHYLDRYKYADRYPEHTQAYYQQQAMVFLQALEPYLSTRPFLFANHPTLADMAILPFVRQFAFVNKAQFEQLTIPQIQRWLASWLESDLLNAVMLKYPAWQTGSEPVFL